MTGYPLVLFHEAAHLLVASEYYVRTLGVAVTPGRAGGISKLGDIPYGQSEHPLRLSMPKSALPVSVLTLYSAERISTPLESWHGGYICLASLERGCDFAKCG